MRHSLGLVTLALALAACPDTGGGPQPPPVGKGEYEQRTGTSEAAPQVAAVAALIRAKYPGLTSLQTKDILKRSARRLGTNACNDTYGCGRLQADEALRQAASGGVTPAPAASPGVAPALPDWSRPRVPGQLLVVSGGEVSAASAPSLRGLAVRQVAAGLARVLVPSGEDERALAARIAAETGAVVQPNYLYRPLGTPTPNDPRLAEQYHLTQTGVRGATGAWTLQTDGVKVAVIDTGADLDHPDLAGRLEIGRDFCVRLVGDPNNPDCEGEDNNPGDEDGHGTHTVGIVGAATNNALGVAGVTQAGRVLVIKAFGQDAQGAAATTVSLAKSINYAANNGAKIINLSLGIPPGSSGSFSDPGVDAAIQAADAKDITLVAAAGNTPGPLYYPASNPIVLAVGSVDRADAVSNFSARGPGLDLVAPGEGILSTKNSPAEAAGRVGHAQVTRP